MKSISKYKVDKTIVIPIILFALISLITLYGADSILPSYMDNLMVKQIFWYVAGFALAYLILTIGNDWVYRSVWILYAIGIVSLIRFLHRGDAVCNRIFAHSDSQRTSAAENEIRSTSGFALRSG